MICRDETWTFLKNHFVKVQLMLQNEKKINLKIIIGTWNKCYWLSGSWSNLQEDVSLKVMHSLSVAPFNGLTKSQRSSLTALLIQLYPTESFQS